MKILTIKDLKESIIFDVSETKWLSDYQNRKDEEGNSRYEIVKEEEDNQHDFILPNTYKQNIDMAKTQRTKKCCGK